MTPTDDQREPERDGSEPDPEFDVDAVDSDGDGSLETTVLTTMEGVDLDGDGVNDTAVMISESMTDLDGDGLPDVIETTKTMIHNRGDGDMQVVQTTERQWVDHSGDLDGETRLLDDPDDDITGLDGLGSMDGLDELADLGELDPTTPDLLAGVQHVAITVGDLAAADHFYLDQLGLQRIERPDFGFPGSWFEAPNGIQLHLIEQPDFTGPTSNHLAFTVTDVDAVCATLRRLGLEVSDPLDLGLGSGRQAFLNDPSGNTIELNQPT